MSGATVKIPLDELDKIRSLRDEALGVIRALEHVERHEDGKFVCPCCGAERNASGWHEDDCKLKEVLYRAERDL